MRGAVSKGGRRLLLFGGTTEGRLLAEYISGLDCPMLVCVATEYGRDLLPPGLRVRTGRLDAAGIKKLIEEEQPGLIIDATHPYAVEVSENIRTAWKDREGIRLLRCLREGESGEPEKGEAEGKPPVVRVARVEDAVKWLSGREGRILVTTGSKELAAYSRLEDYKSRLIVRILPAAPAVEACQRLGIEADHIIVAQGPFSEEANRRQLRNYNCSFLVTKDGGRAGGFLEKIRAAGLEGAVAVVIERPGMEEGLPLEEIKRQVWEWIEQKEG